MTAPAAPVGRRALSAAAGAAVGATVWLSLGVLALVDIARGTRVAMLPSWTWLAACVCAGAALGAAGPVRAGAAAPAAILAVLWLPWLPWRLPPAFLLWDGPLEGAVWLAFGAGLAWTGTSRARARLVTHDLWRSPARAPWIAGALAAAICVGAWAVARPRVPAGDEPHYLVITQSLLTDGDLRIEDNHRRGDYLAYYDGVLKPDFMRRGTDRQIYSIHAPGVSAVVLPAFALAGYAGAVVTIALIAGLGVALVWRTAFAMTASVEAAWVAGLAVATSAPMVLHGFTVYPDPLGAVCVIAGVAALVTLAAGRPLTTPAGAAVGAALALLPWLHTRFAVLAAVLGVAVAARLVGQPGGWRRLGAFAAAPLVAAAGWFAYFWRIYGTPNPAAPYGVGSGAGPSFVPTGVGGLLLDQSFGLAANAPVLLVGLALFVPFVRRRPRLGLELLAVVVPYLALAGSYPMWWGGYSAPARFAVAVLPVLAFPLADTFAQGGGLRRAVIGASALVSAAITGLLVAVDRGAFIYNDRGGHALLLDWLSATVDLTLALPSVHRDGVADAASDTAVWGVALALVAAMAGRVWRLDRGWWTRAVAWLAAPGLLMLAATVVWAGHAADVQTPATSQMAWIGRSAALGGGLGLQIGPLRLAAPAELVTRLELATSPRGGRRTGPQPLLRIPFVPPGDYDVFVDARDRRSTLDGTLTVRLGRHDLPIETWTLAGRPRGFTGLTLRLPVEAHSITITGDEAARDAIARLVLRPRVLTGRGPLALRAMRIGRVVVFALDDRAYLEPGAFWVRGERQTAVVLTPDSGRPPVLRLKAGPVATTVALGAGGWSQSFDLAADAAVDVPLPAEAVGPGGLTIASSAGFRPSATDDVRWLGVYVTLVE